MGTTQSTHQPTFRVLDAMDAPHGGRILRLRLDSGEPPSIGSLKGARLQALSPDGQSAVVRVKGFALFGGKPSDERLARTGRIDLHVETVGDGPDVVAKWEIRP